MKQIIYFCDRCGVEIDRLYKIIGHEVDRNTGDYLEDAGVDIDFCYDCYHKLMSGLTEIHSEEEEVDNSDEEVDEEVDEPDEKEVEEKPKKKPPLSQKERDKIKKLFDNGHSVKEIANSMEVCPATVYRIINA